MYNKDTATLPLAAPVSNTFSFVNFMGKSEQLATLQPPPPPAIIDDGDGMAHIASNLTIDSDTLDKGLVRLIDAVLHHAPSSVCVPSAR